MNRQGQVFYKNVYCGLISETDKGYEFCYDLNYLKNAESKAISLNLPLSEKTYTNQTLFAFFDGLIPEGWLLDIAEKHWKINDRDRMGLLLSCCKDCIGAISVINYEKL